MLRGDSLIVRRQKDDPKMNAKVGSVPSPTGWPSWMVLAFFGLIGVILYANTFSASFHFDDLLKLVRNPVLRDFFAVDRIWEYGRPRFLSYWSFSLNQHFFGNSLFSHHVVNLNIHVLTSFFVFSLVRLGYEILGEKEKGSRSEAFWMAVMTGMVFLCHPLQTQAVTYIIQRMALLAALFVILSVYQYMLFRAKGRRRHYVLSILFAFAGMFCKENAYTVFLLLPLAEMTFFSKLGERTRGFWCLVAFLPLLGIAYFLIYHGAVIKDGVGALTKADTDLSRIHYLLTQFNVLRTYLRLLFIPLNQNLDYDYTVSETLLEPMTLLSLGLILCVLIFGIWIFKKNRIMAFGIFWCFAALSIESSIFSVKDVIFEHRLYLPMLGFAVVLMELINRWTKNRKEFIWVSAVIVGMFSVLTIVRNSVWKDEISLWEDTLKKSPQKARPHVQLGSSYGERGRHDKALPLFLRAVELDPEYANAYYNLGVYHLERNQLDAAVENLEKAVLLGPDDPVFHYNLGIERQEQGDRDSAAASYLKTLELSPQFTRAHNNLGVLHHKKGDYDGAIRHYQRAAEIDPKFVDAYYNLGLAYSKKSDFQSAIRYFLEALLMHPQKLEYSIEAGVAYVKAGEYEEAERYFQAALKINPSSVEARKNLVIAYLKRGQGDAAERELKALEALGEKTLADRLRQAENESDVFSEKRVRRRVVHFQDGQVIKTEETIDDV
jgi:tetratricopeptide (TPR) repeat protein